MSLPPTVPPPLGNEAVDYVTAAAKATLSAVPFVGSALAEFAGAVIPNQRIDRVAAFAVRLEQRLSQVQQQLLKQAMATPEFGDVIEESMRQAAGSLSDGRRVYLAALVENALDAERVSAIDARHLLRLLGQINDVEVIVLRSHLVQTLNGDDEFRERHASVVNPVPVMLNSDQATIDRGALWEGYRHHLTQLGLLEERLQVDRKTKQPVFEPAQGRYGVAGHELSSLGRLLLRMIGLSTDGFDTTDRVSAL